MQTWILCLTATNHNRTNMHLYIQQIQWPLAMLTLVLVQAQFTWIVLTAMAMRVIFSTVCIALLLTVHLATQKMLE